jgi:DNA modification methylase
MLLVRDGQTLPMIPALSVAAIITAPPYWAYGRGRTNAGAYARRLALRFGREWKRVLTADGDLWLVVGDRHDGDQWVGVDDLVAGWFRRAGWGLQAKGFWAEHPSASRWDERVNTILRLKKKGALSLPPHDTLCWRLPLPPVPEASLWNGIPFAITRKLLSLSPKGRVLDPFAGTGTVLAAAGKMGRPWIGVERDFKEARFAVRRLRLRPANRPFVGIDSGPES